MTSLRSFSDNLFESGNPIRSSKDGTLTKDKTITLKVFFGAPASRVPSPWIAVAAPPDFLPGVSRKLTFLGAFLGK